MNIEEILEAMDELLERILAECHPYTAQGNLANYIPELAKANKNDFGISIFDNIANIVFRFSGFFWLVIGSAIGIVGRSVLIRICVAAIKIIP